MTEPRAVDTCEQCGQTDDHPKVQMGAFGGDRITVKHHDCLSAREREMVEGSSDKAAQVIQACIDGKRGDDLLAHIRELHADQGEQSTETEGA